MSKPKKSCAKKPATKTKAVKSYQAPSLKKMQKLAEVTGGTKVTGSTVT